MSGLASGGDPLVALVADDLIGGVRNMRARAVDCDTSASNFEQSARRERALAAEFRAKADALTELLPLIGITVPVPAEPESAPEPFPRPV